MSTTATQLRECIRLLERALGIVTENNLSCCDMTLAQCHALVEIGRAGCISLVDLANTLGLDNSTLSRTVAKLDERGYCTRQIDPENRRYLQIVLTEAGKVHFETIETNMNEYYSGILDCIPHERRDALLEDLSLLLDAIAKTECCRICEKER